VAVTYRDVLPARRRSPIQALTLHVVSIHAVDMIELYLYIVAVGLLAAG